MSEVTTTLVSQSNESVTETPAPPPAPEAPKEEVKAAPPAPPEDPQFSRKFSALSKKEKELRMEAESIKQQRAEYQQYQQAIANAKKNPLEAIKAQGLSLEELITYALDPEAQPQAPSKEDQLAETVAQIAAKVKEYEDAGVKHQQELAEAKNQKVLETINNDIKTFIDQNSETYELIKLNNVEHEVWTLIETMFIETDGKVTLTQEQAAQMLEKELEKEAEAELAKSEKIKTTKKYRAKYAPAEKTTSKSSSYEDSKTELVSKPSPTLTNNSVSIGQEAPSAKLLSAEESLKRAASLLKWK